MTSSSDSISRAEKCNEAARQLIKYKNYNKALELYNLAIEFDSTNCTYYSNRSFCYEKLENYGLAIQDASKCLEIDPSFHKAYFRRALAQLSIGHLSEALGDLRFLHEKYPKEKSIADRYNYCKKAHKEHLLAKAIEYEEKSPLDLIDLESLSILDDDSYEFTIVKNRVTPEYVVKLMEAMKNKHRLKVSELKKILILSRDILKSKRTLVRYDIPENGRLTICGDVHGQYYDLCHIFEINGFPSVENPYLFNGDFVDRGSFSVEVIILLLAYMVCYPNHFLLNRGNHECICMNEVYGFKDEVVEKYSLSMFNLFTEVFKHLPVCHLINEKVIHGGLPQDPKVSIKDMENMSRIREPSEGSPMHDILWCDPSEKNGRTTGSRGVSTDFGPDVTDEFLQRNNLEYIIRSHEAQMDGYKISHNNKCITIFSAPNYWYYFKYIL